MTSSFPSSAELVRVLSSDSDLHSKAYACQQLAVVGTADAVPALAKLLGDDKLGTYARSALELIAEPAAGVALRQALAGLDGARLAGVIDSLGVRREVAAVPELCKLATGTTPAAAEALAALGKIATGEAVACLVKVMGGEAVVPRLAAGHAALVAAGVLLKQGEGKAAVRLLDAVAAAELPAHVTAAAAGLRSQARRRRLFDGKSFTGWDGDLTWFRIADGAVVGGSLTKALGQNEFLSSKQEFGDFELRLSVRLIQGKGNGGIQFRSKRVPNSREMAGYQADMAAEYWGGLYDESRRNTFLGSRPDQAAIAKIIKPNDWNEYRIRCEGARIRLWLNGTLTVDFTETDPAVARRGQLGLQIHSGPPSEAWYKDIEIEELD